MTTDVRARIADALRECHSEALWCQPPPYHRFAEVLLSLPGIAVVLLPPPDDDGDYLRQKPHTDATVKPTGVSGIPLVAYDKGLMPAYFARILAAALLAAANAAEATA